MTRESVLSDGREFVADGFSETFDFFYVTTGVIPDGEIDPVDVETIVHGDIPGLLKSHTIQVSDREAAGQLVGVQQLMVKVGVDSTPDVREGHFCRCTASTVDASLVGRVVRIAGWPQGGQTTSHRYPVEEV